MGAFFGKEQLAENAFTNAEKKCQDIYAKVMGVKDKPKVFWGMTYQGKAYVSGADSYVAKMIEMAGGDYLFKDSKGTGSSSITLEEYYAKGREADVFISSTLPNYGMNSIAKLTELEKVLADLPTIKEGKVWCYQPWYYQSLDKTDEMINDLAAIFYPDLFAGTQLKQFMKLPQS
jgi:ABC-type Fe3+-hydroxamate transport system, periplasmic component